jgi:hypothetical protein
MAPLPLRLLASLAVLSVASCAGSDQHSEVDTLWLSYWRTSTNAEELLLIQEDGSYTIASTPAAPWIAGDLDHAERARLEQLLRPELTGSYEADSLLNRPPAASCDPSPMQPVVYSLLWEPTASSTSNGFACWAQAGTQSATTQELIDVLNTVLGSERMSQ